MTDDRTHTVVRMLHAVDDLDWDTVRASVAAKLTIDYTSLWGGEPQQTTRDQLVASWQELLPGFDLTQHLIGPVAVTQTDDHTAICDTNVRGYHRIGGENGGAWLVAGRYQMSLVRTPAGWRIDGITLRLAYEEGPRELVETARQRVASGQGRARGT